MLFKHQIGHRFSFLLDNPGYILARDLDDKDPNKTIELRYQNITGYEAMHGNIFAITVFSPRECYVFSAVPDRHNAFILTEVNDLGRD